MSYIVFCTFDLENASSTDYENAYAELELIGLKKVIVSQQGSDVVMPTTSTIGEFNGNSVSEIRDSIRNQVKNAFKKHRFKSEIFVLAAKNWAWGATTT